MAEIRRLVTLDSVGVATPVLDFNTSLLKIVSRSTHITAPPPNTIYAKRERRFGGSQVIGEHHDNGSFAWTAIVGGSSVDNFWLNHQAIVSVLQSTRTDLFLEWRPDGATNSTFYEVAGPITWNAQYDWAQMTTVKSNYLDIDVPFKPLGLLPAQTFNIPSSTLPTTIALPGIGGDAPALANVTLRTNGGLAPPVWAMFGWNKDGPAPLAGCIAPFGIIEAENMTSGSLFTVIGSDVNYRNSNGQRFTASGAQQANIAVAIDPSVMTPDDFSNNEIDIEVWARIEISSTIISPTIQCVMYPLLGTAYGGLQYAAPYGTAGKIVTLPSSGTRFRTVRLGVLTMPIDTAAPTKWQLLFYANTAAGSTGTWGVDYLMLVPARSRACSKTGVVQDGAYPPFIGSTVDTSKTIFGNDLSGMTGAAAFAKGRDSGIGGSPIELLPGNNTMLLKLSSLVPDDPTTSAATEQINHTGVLGSVTVFPRVYLAKGQ